MQFKLFIELDGNLTDISDVKISNFNNLEKDWYYLQGSIEVINEKAEVYISREDTTDIIPFIYEFFSLFYSAEIAREAMSGMSWTLSNKICSSTTLYHPEISEIMFKRMNDVYLEIRFLYQNGDYKHFNFEENNFFNDIKMDYDQFDKAIRILYPNTEIGMLDDLKKIIRNT